jgi:monovalent cation/hydrogen antiporter
MTSAAAYEFLVCLLLAIVVLELLARRLRLPPAAAFIVGGIVLALTPGVPAFGIDPDLVLLVFMPPLLIHGAFFTVWREFRENLSGIFLLAVGAVIFTTLAVGVVTRWLVPTLPWAACFALGAIVSPPDAVAAEAVLQRLPLPGRISALLQGESLLNDASGLVLFRFAVAAALTGIFSTTSAIVSFCVLSVGGVAVGLIIGQLGLLVIRRLRDSELIITTTLLLASVSYIGAERLHVSGVLATVATGLLLGWRQHSLFTATTRVRAEAFWKVLVFLLESILFILIGLSLRGVLVRLGGLAHAGRALWLPVLGVLGAVVLSRFVWLFGSDIARRIARRFGLGQRAAPSFSAALVMSWAGMRGVVTLATALAWPVSLPGRDFVLVSAFTVILVTVLVQGTTLESLIRSLRINRPDEARRRRESEDLAWMRMTRAQYQAIAAVSQQPDGSERHPRLLEQYAYRARVAAEYNVDREAHNPVKNEHFNAVLAAIEAGRNETLRMHRSGEIHDRVLRVLEQELDLQQMVAESHVD